MIQRNPTVPSTHPNQDHSGLDPDETQKAHEDQEDQEQAAAGSPQKHDTTRLPEPGGAANGVSQAP